MSQWDPQARSSQQCDRMQVSQEQSRPRKGRFYDRMRILKRLGRQAPWTWPAAMLLVVLSHPVLAQAGPPPATDVTPGQMHIGERIIEGEIREKEKAKKEYEAAKTAGRRTGLIEQQRAILFTTSVANIGPGETITIEIEYLETLRYDEGNFSLRFPLTLTPRATVFTETIGGQPHLLIMLLPPNDLSNSTPDIPRELIFVVDTSGSMHGSTGNRCRTCYPFAAAEVGGPMRFVVTAKMIY